MEAADGAASVRGATLHYTSIGRGPVCLVPTAIGAAPYRRMMPPPIPDHLRLVFVELRGSGRSTGDPTELTFDGLADDLDAVRTELGADRVAVLGHSILGVLALEYARRRPESVSHVILAGTPPTGNMAAVAAASGRFFEELASAERKEKLRDNLARLPEGASMGEAMYAQTPMRFFDADFDAAPLFEGADSRTDLLKHLLGTLTPTWKVENDAESLRVPILVAHGRHDYTVPHVLWDGVLATLPNTTMARVRRERSPAVLRGAAGVRRCGVEVDGRDAVRLGFLGVALGADRIEPGRHDDRDTEPSVRARELMEHHEAQ